MTGDRNRLAVAAFISGAFLAGVNPVAIRFSNRELAPLWGAGLRFSIAAVLLAMVMAFLKLRLPRGRELRGAIVYGVLQFAGAFGLGYYALVRIHAGLGATLLALVPLATLLLAVVQRQEKLTPSAVVGTFLGLAGVVLISSGVSNASLPLPSLLAVLGSVLCFGEAAVVVRRFPGIHPVTMNAVGMMAASVVLIGGALLTFEPMVLPHRPATWLAIAYIASIGSVVVFLLYVFLINSWSASRASYVMVVTPFVTVVLSAWLDKEVIVPGLAFGGILIIAGVYIGALRSRAMPELI
ncbi:MAG: DMT family transporter [Actinomycetota bacterium]